MFKNEHYLKEILKGVYTLMSQIDDLKTAVSTELADVQSLLTKLTSLAGDNPDVAAVITQLQSSHTAIQNTLNPPATVVSTPVANG